MAGVRLSVSGLSAGYGGPPAIEGLDFELHAGERIGVLGPNGGGKSTLFRVLLGEIAPSSGTVTGPHDYGLVPQTERSRLDYPVSALDVALMGTLSRVPWWRRVGKSERRFALEALGRVGLAAHTEATFGELSGGQRQRVLVARALVQDAQVLLLDEPFTGVDQPSAELLEALLRDLAAEGRGILIATHDLDQTLGWDKVLCVNGRQVAFGTPAETLTRAVLEEIYGGSIVTLPGDGGGVGILPAHHHHHDGEGH
ncbi:MAG: metal ABC transporter ATP-binding protein [Actinomycetes bacterium]